MLRGNVALRSPPGLPVGIAAAALASILVPVAAAADERLHAVDTWMYQIQDLDDPEAGDLRNRHFDHYTTEARLVQTDRYRAFGLPVFSVDYAIDPANVALVYQEAPRHGLVPLVTRVSLSRPTTTPPPWL